MSSTPYIHRQDYSYDLPEILIAQSPAVPRDSSRLLHLNRSNGEIKDSCFNRLGQFLRAGDLLVINNSRVIPARLLGKKKGAGSNAEVLLLEDKKDDRWECLCKPARRLTAGSCIVFSQDLEGTIEQEIEGGNRIIKFSYDPALSFDTILEQVGHTPLPHYIRGNLSNAQDYQTVYAKHPGSVAAPTAGLHFTKNLMQQLSGMGIGFAQVTLHVGLGTFRPVRETQITDHHMHSERYSISEQTAAQINATREQGGRIIAVGTTSCRTLEASFNRHNGIEPCAETTDIFIYPGYEFKLIDALITNFHLPESTLIMLVCAFAGYETTMQAYRHAVESSYRFYSFGDAMLIT